MLGQTSMPAWSLAVSHDGTQMAYTSEAAGVAAPTSIQLWRLGSNGFVPLQWTLATTQSSKSLRSFHAYPVQCEFSSDDQTLTVAYIRAFQTPAQFVVAAWNTKTGKQLWHFDGLKNFAPARLFLSPQGRQLAVCEWEKEKLTLFDLSRPRPIPHSKDALARDFSIQAVFPIVGDSVAWTPDGQTLTVYTGPHIEFWNIKNKTHILPDTSGLPSSGGSRQMRWSPDGRLLATSDTVNLAIWNKATRTWTSISYTGDSPYGTFSLAWMPDSQSLWVGGEGASVGAGHVQQMSAFDLKMLREYPISGPVALSSDGRTLATRNMDKGSNSVWLWNTG